MCKAQKDLANEKDPLFMGLPDIQNTNICCGLFRAGFHSSERRQYSGTLS